MERKRLVVIGGGMASIAFLDEITRLGNGYEITVIGEERHNYNRIFLAQVLTGEKGLDDILLHGPEWFREKGIVTLPGKRVESINRARRTLSMEGGEEVRYDRLVIATGAVPFIPPIPGVEKEGVHAFRRLEDCRKIKESLKDGVKAVVMGGGLLGLEAAYSLRKAGAEVTVVHLMERLMERQLDSVSASFLRDDLEKLGIGFLLGREAASLTGGKRVEGIAFRDGSSIDADLVVFSTGIKPNIALAKASGIVCARGILVSDTMQTYDPSVYAVGECVEHRGETFGLVGPVFEQARVLANHLAGDCRLIFRKAPVSARLKVPSIDLYSAGETGEGASPDTIEYLDRPGRVYKKIVLKDGRITGIIMYGDTADGPRLFSLLADGSDVSSRRRLLFGDEPGGVDRSVDAIPDDAIVCGCNGVTKKAIIEAVEKKGLFSRAEVARETKASSSCGGCAGLVDRILEAALGSDFKTSGETSICACTRYSREDVIKNIREKKLTSVSEVMDTLGWETVGCDTCRPAINYYVSMVWPGEALDDGTSRLVNERAHANIQKDGTFSVVPRMYGGVVTVPELKRIARAAEKFAVPLVKITGGQRIALMGIRKEDLSGVWKAVGMPSGFAYGKAIRTVKTCVGEKFCRYGTQDSLSLGIEIEKALSGLWMPAKVKIGVSGCPRNCAEYDIKDVGIAGVAGGFEVHAGGCGGIEVKEGELLASCKTAQEAKDVLFAFIQMYREEAHYGERTFKWVRRAGIKNIKEAIAAENGTALRKRLEEALMTASRDPWKERIENPCRRKAR